jgi:hypothetical protein
MEPDIMKMDRCGGGDGWLVGRLKSGHAVVGSQEESRRLSGLDA